MPEDQMWIALSDGYARPCGDGATNPSQRLLARAVGGERLDASFVTRAAVTEPRQRKMSSGSSQGSSTAVATGIRDGIA
jgi:hypothetical protein